MKFAITTSGGDAPGLNAVIRGATETALRNGHTLLGIRHGFDGLLREGELVELTHERVRGIERHGGTILKAASGGNPFGGNAEESLARLAELLRDRGIDGLIMTGGDGTLQIAHAVSQAGVPVVAVPKTIDRDVYGTYLTFGFLSAVNRAVEAIDDIHDTAASHERLMVIEVMGRDAGWIALYSGMGASADMIALPEIPYRMERFAEHIRRREAEGQRYHILVCSEGAHGLGEEGVMNERTGRYGGVGEVLAAELSERTGKEARAVRLGHQLRGGAPEAFDRVLALQYGAEAVNALCRGEAGVMVSFDPPELKTRPIPDLAGKLALIGPESNEVATARSIGICFGD